MRIAQKTKLCIMRLSILRFKKQKIFWSLRGSAMVYLEYVFFWIVGKFRKIYFMALPESKEDLLRSRKLYTTGDSASQTIGQISGGTFLVALMTSIGISDGNMGIILSIPSLAALFQLLFMNFVQRLEKRKLFICFCNLQKIWLGFIYFIPFFDWSVSVKMSVFLAAFLLGQIFSQICAPATTDWLASLVPSRLRSRYFSIKDSIVVFVIITISLIAGVAFDQLEKVNVLYGFSLIGSTIFLLVIIVVVTYSMINEPRLTMINEYGIEMHGNLLRKAKLIHPPIPKQQNLITETIAIFHNRPLRAAFLLNFLWMFSFYSASPFNSSYQVKELQLSYTFIMTTSFITNLIRVILTPKIGKRAGVIGAPKMLKYVLVFYALGYAFLILKTPETSILFYLLSMLFSSLSWTYIGIGLLEIQLNFMDRDKRTIQYTILSVLSGVLGFIISTVFGHILDLLQQIDLHLAGHKIYAQQVTNSIGILFTLTMIIYLHFVVGKIQVKQDHKDGTLT